MPRPTARAGAPASALDPGGPAAAAIATLWWVMFAVGTVVFVAVVALIVIPIVRRWGRGDSDDGSARPEMSERTTNRWIVGGGVVLPVMILVPVLTLSVLTMRDIPQDTPPGSLQIEVVGYQYWWSIRYPDADVGDADVIHIPVGEPVELTITSADVIHSFWVPGLNGKVDALPDGPNTLVIRADTAGEYRGVCAEFCGLSHAEMTMTVIALPAEEFAAWLDAHAGMEAAQQ